MNIKKESRNQEEKMCEVLFWAFLVFSCEVWGFSCVIFLNVTLLAASVLALANQKRPPVS